MSKIAIIFSFLTILGLGGATSFFVAPSASAQKPCPGNSCHGNTTTVNTTTTATTTTSAPATTTTTSAPSATTTTSASGRYFATDPSGQATSKSGPSPATGLPRGAAYCADNIIRVPTDPRPDNYTANHTVGDGSYNWGSYATDPYWTAWAATVPLVQGQFTGTTTEMFSWAACRWGIDEDTLRAVAVVESGWHVSDLGDVCGPPGEASYGIMQVKNADCTGALAWGGLPDTVNSTALNVDFYGAHFRACYDGDFYDGGSWLYGGQTVAQVAAVHGWNYVFWGCVGFWYSGGWYDSGAQSYISAVKTELANKPWLSY